MGPPVQLPVGSATISVKLLNPVNFGPSQINRFMSPPVPGLETFPSVPSFSFLLGHPSGRNLVFDLGIRKDYQNYSKKVADYIPTTKYKIDVEQNVVDILEAHGVDTSTIETIIWGHWHWDHIGDPSSFPKSTALIVGPGFKDAMLPGYPTNPDSPIRESDYEGRDLREINFDDPGTLQVGKFRAFDYFEDGSFYLLDSPGHAIGHLCGLARTTSNPDTFALLGSDICHYAGIFRPSEHLPIPESITPHPCYMHSETSFCPGAAFDELQRRRGRQPTDTLYDMTFGHDVPLAIKTMRQLQEVDCNENVFVIISHDATIRDGVEHFPASLNDWKAKGWGKALKWAFLRDMEVYWQENGAMVDEHTIQT